MDIEDWWPRLEPVSRQWLIDNNGDAVRGDILAEITEVGGPIAEDAWWVGDSGPGGFFFSDRAVDWIDAVANGEDPDPAV